MNILIVDDLATNRKLLRVTLEAGGYSALEAADGIEALAVLERETTDAVISDILMPRMDGYRLCQEVRKSKRFGQLPFIFYSSTYTSQADQKFSGEIGADCFIKMPASPEVLIEALRGATTNPHRQPKRVDLPAELSLMKEYNQLLVAKLEERNVELADRNEELEKLAQKLEQEARERKTTQETFERLRNLHELILNSAGEGIYGRDLTGNIIFKNPKAAELLGWTAGELLGRSAHEIIHHTRSDGSSYPLEACPISQSIRDGVTRRVTNDVFWRKDGTSFRVDYVCAPIKHQGGQIVGSIVTFKDITEQFAAEARLKLQEQQYRLLFETNPNSMWVFDTKSLQVLAVNEVAIAQYGYSRSEFLKLNLKDLQPSDDLTGLMQARVLDPPTISHDSNHFRHVRKDGTQLLVEIYSGALLWEDVPARIVTAIDVTERQRAGERMKAILDSALDCIVTMDDQGRIVEFNPAAEKTFGYKQDEAVGQQLADLIIPPAQREKHQRGLTHYLASGEGPVLGKHIELSAVRRDGTEFPVELAIIRIGSQDPPMFTGFIRDISKRKQTAEALRTTHEKLRYLLTYSPTVIYSGKLNAGDAQLSFISENIEKVTGFSAAEAVQPNWWTAHLHPDDRTTAMDPETEWSTREQSRHEYRFQGKDGQYIWIDDQRRLVRDTADQSMEIIGSWTDITEKKELEAKFLRAQRLESIGTLASGVAHDLNNVLVPILIAAPLLRGDMPQDERDKFLTIVEESAQRGASIVRQVLTFARGADGDRVLLQPMYLLEEIAKIAAQTFPKSITLRTRYPQDLRTLEADPTQLHQILLNLCVNARDAMPDGGTLTLSAENFDVDDYYATMTPGAKAGPHVMLQVTDTGTGIPRHVIDKIFDPFFTTKAIGTGTGLGLSTVAGIVKSHGGFVSVYSQPGHTSFKVFIPSVISESELVEASVTAPLPSGHGETVLLVDDEPGIRKVAQGLLTKHGYKVMVAEDGTEALALFAGHFKEIDVVLTDLVMPFIDGLALVRTLRKMKPDIKVIVSTGRGEGNRTAEMDAMHLNDCLTKPYTREKILTTLDKVLGKQIPIVP
ncbi:MAG: hypothetical protein QOG67_2257 [Verrucomicrobiota bacterium]|jgi:PAS domain S-box-containing protein